MNDWRLNVIELAWLTDEQAELFEGDFRFVVDVLRSIRLRRDFVLTDQVIEHVDAVLKFLAALTGERRLENLPNIERGNPMTVRNIFADTWDKIRQESREEGFMRALFSLVNDGTISLAAAAARANMSEADFRAQMREADARKDER